MFLSSADFALQGWLTGKLVEQLTRWLFLMA